MEKIRRKDEAGSAARPMLPSGPRRSVHLMNRHLLLILLAFGLLLLALAGWTVQGLRWTVSGRRRRRGRLVPA
jgi:hypothetical protein